LTRGQAFSESKRAEFGATKRLQAQLGLIVARHAQNPQTSQPEDVHQHNCLIMPGSNLEGALRKKRRCIVAREKEFRNSLCSHRSEEESSRRLAALFMETPRAAQ